MSCVIAIFPISGKVSDALFCNEKNVFPKFTHFRRIQPNSKIVFYQTRKKQLVGEATVEAVVVCNPKTAWAEYGKKMCYDEHDFKRDFLSLPPQRGRWAKWTLNVYLLKDIRKISTTNEWRNDYSINLYPAGCYITPEEYKKIKIC